MIRNVRSVGLVVVGPVVFAALLGVVAAAAPACSTFAQAPTDGADASTVDASEPLSDATVQPVRVDPKIAPLDKLTLILGSPATLKVKVERGSIPDAFDVELVGLPKGVTAPKATIAFGQSAVELTLTVSENADIGPVKVTVNATSPAGNATGSLVVEVRGAPGTLDKSFGNGGLVTRMDSFQRVDTVIRPDGGLLWFGRTGIPEVVKLRPDGTDDPAFGTNGSTKIGEGAMPYDVPSAMVQSASADIYASLVDTEANALVVRKLDASGKVLSYGPGGVVSIVLPGVNLTRSSSTGGGLVVLPDGSLVAAAVRSFDGGGEELEVLHIGSNGEHDSAWGLNGVVSLLPCRPSGGTLGRPELFVDDRGRLRVSFYNYDSTSLNGSLCAHAFVVTTGKPDPSFGVAGYKEVSGMALSLAPSLGSGGTRDYFWTAEDHSANVVRLGSSGAVDATFGNAGRLTFGADYQSVRGGAIDSSGRILLGLRSRSKVNFLEVARLLPTGVLDASFNATGSFAYEVPISNQMYNEAVLVQPDGRITVVGRNFSPGASASYAVRLWPWL